MQNTDDKLKMLLSVNIKSMIDVNKAFRTLRVNLREHGIKISEDVFRRFHPATLDIGVEICVFCQSNTKLTKEHVIPKWLFERDIESRFVSSVNRQTQSYNKATIPACSDCNNIILSKIERHVIRVTQQIDAGNVNIDGLCDIIRWLEIIDYKAQVYDCRRKYLRYASEDYDPSWGVFSIAIMRHFIEMNPFKALDYIRRAQRRITVKAKKDRINSLAIFRTTAPHFNFFTQPDEYIYVSFPKYQVSVFYFLRQKFYDYQEAFEEALYYIDRVSKS